MTFRSKLSSMRVLSFVILFAAAPSQGFSVISPTASRSTRTFAVPMGLASSKTMASNATAKTPIMPEPVLMQAFRRMNSNKNTIGQGMAAVTLGMALLLMSPSAPAEAAMSGGRMGGSYASPAPMMQSAPSRSYSSSPSYGYSPTIIAPVVTPYYSSPIVPLGGGGAVLAAPRPSIFDLFFYGAVASVIFSIASGKSSSATEAVSALGPGTSVVVASLAFQVPNRDDSQNILSKLQRLSETAETDSRQGLQALTSEVALELLRATKQGNLRSAYADTQQFDNVQQSNRQFQKTSVRERSKFARETVAKYGGVDSSEGQLSKVDDDDWDDNATMAVVTLVLHVRGDSMLQSREWSSEGQVREILAQIASEVGPNNGDDDDCLQGAEILWTPADRSETLTPRDVVVDYPELRTMG